MEETYQALLELEKLDQQITETESRRSEVAPKLEGVEEPVLELDKEVGGLRKRLDGMKKEVRRLERGADEKRERLETLQDHMDRVRNEREEAAVRSELELVERALDSDEQDALELMERVTRTELKLEEMEEKLSDARAEVEPHRQELLQERADLDEELAVLEDKRENRLIRLDEPVRELYGRVTGGRSDQALAALMPDGACGNCFSMVPLQRQAEIRRGDELYRCDFCGVILYPEMEEAAEGQAEG